MQALYSRRLPAWIVTVAMISALGSSVESQTRVIEQKLRFRTWDDSSSRTVAWYAGQTGDTLYVLAPSGGQVEGIPFGRIKTLERYRGMKSHALEGMGIGLGVGVIISLGMTTIWCEGTSSSTGTCFGVGMLVLGGPAVALGALVGTLYRTEHWEDVPIAPLPVHVGFLPGSRVVRIGVSLGF